MKHLGRHDPVDDLLRELISAIFVYIEQLPGWG
jgi:hypothetical protein